MKRKIFIFFSLLMLALANLVHAEEVIEREHHFNLDDFKFEYNGNKIKVFYAKPWLDNYMEEMPHIPNLAYEIIMPKDVELTALKWEVEERVLVASEVDLVARPIDVVGPPIGLDQWPAYNAYDGTYPSKEAKLKWEMQEYMINKYNSLVYWIFPFDYDPDKKELYFTPKISLSITVKSTGTETRLDNIKSQCRFSNIDVFQYIGSESEAGLMALDSLYNYSSDSKLDYLVITQQDLKNSFDKLVNWKTKKGLKCKVVSIEEIYSEIHTGSESFKIKKYIDSLYRTQGLSYVLLGGDGTVVPVQKTYGSIKLSENGGTKSYTGNLIPADIYYACLKGRLDWNADNDNNFGEAGVDLANLIPDVIVTRIPIKNNQNIEDYTKKLISYEKFGPTNPDRLLLAGVQFYTGTEEKSDAHSSSDMVYGSYIEPFWDGEVVRRFDTYKDNTWKGEVVPQTLIDEFSKGYSFANIASHGEKDGWLLQYNSKFTKAHNAKINSNAGTVVTSEACYINAFDQKESLGSSLICAPDNGIVALYALSEKGLGVLENQLGTTQYFIGTFYQNLFQNPNESKNFGKIISLSKKQFARLSSTEGVRRWIYYALNGMGDPEMPIFTQTPKKFTNVKVTKEKYLTINAGVDSCTISVTGILNGRPYQMVKRNTRSLTIFGDYPANGEFCITKQNYLPYIGSLRLGVIVPQKLDNEVLDNQGKINSVMHLPGSVSLTVQFELSEYSESCAIMLTEVSGKEHAIFSCSPEETSIDIDVSSFSKGIYSVALIVNNEIVDSKQVIIN